MNVGEPAQLYLIDSRTRRATSLFPTDNPVMQLDAALRTGCTGLFEVSTNETVSGHHRLKTGFQFSMRSSLYSSLSQMA
jgi:hypothetical protein